MEPKKKRNNRKDGKQPRGDKGEVSETALDAERQKVQQRIKTEVLPRRQIKQLSMKVHEGSVQAAHQRKQKEKAQRKRNAPPAASPSNRRAISKQLAAVQVREAA